LHVTYWSPYSRSQKLQPHAAAGQPVSARSPVSTIGVRESQAVQPHAAAGQPVSARSPVSTIGVRESQAVP